MLFFLLLTLLLSYILTNNVATAVIKVKRGVPIRADSGRARCLNTTFSIHLRDILSFFFFSVIGLVDVHVSRAVRLEKLECYLKHRCVVAACCINTIIT